ncbi:MAG: spore maturation protein CgeB [Planctomycetota bacterium]|jgi:spore maturation protein CgeB
MDCPPSVDPWASTSREVSSIMNATTRLPSPTVLERNYTALSETDPAISTRLSWPFGDKHLIRDEEGVVTGYMAALSERPLAVEWEGLEEAVRALPDEGTALIFGLGLGEILECTLRLRPELSIVAWDRDPALMIETLCRVDGAEAIREGRLRFALGVDLLDELEHASVLRHPLLSHIYWHEFAWLGQEIGLKRACVGTGRLFVDDLAVALRSEEFTVLPIDFEGLAVEEADYAIERFDPELIAVINYTHGLAEFCEERGRALRVWEIDPTTDQLQTLTTSSKHIRIHTWRKANVEEYRKAGFDNVEYLPLASDTDKRRPLELSAEELKEYSAAVSFVGSSLLAEGQQLRADFEQLHSMWHAKGARGRRTLDRILAAQEQSPDRYVLPELAQEAFGSFLQAVRNTSQKIDPVALIAESASSVRRQQAIARLAPYGLDVWGDDGWVGKVPAGGQYRGQAGHHRQLNRIYNASTINVDIGRLYQLDIVTMRVFDILACGGFLIAERNEGLAELFELGVELESYATLDELEEKVGYYLRHPDAARAIADCGMRAVREKHTIQQRVREILS